MPNTPLAPPYHFDPQVQAWFEKAGWYPGRAVAVQQPEKGGYPPAVVTLLQEFVGLRVGPSNRFIDFDPLAAEGDYDDVGDFFGMAQDFGCQLYCLGETAEYNRVLVNKHGGVYTFGADIILHGMSFTEGINNILLDRWDTIHCFNRDDNTWDEDHHRITWPDLPPTP